MPARDGTNGPTGRKAAKTLLHDTTPDHLGIDLINDANSGSAAIPAVAEALFGTFTQLRGIYLSALDAMILPSLPDVTIAGLEEAGAVVLENEIVTHVRPMEDMNVTADADRWHLRSIEIDAARRKGLTGKGVTIGFLDTGIDPDHPEFAGKQIIFQDFAEDGSKRHSRKARDYQGHGTHVAAISAGLTGVAPDARIAMACVLNNKDSELGMVGYRNQIVAGLNWLAVEALGAGEAVDIVNASLGQNFDARDYLAVRGYVDGGILLVASIGNSGHLGPGNHRAPGMYDCTLAVGAVDRDHNIAGFSDWGHSMPVSNPATYKPDLVAPGVNVLSALPGGHYGLLSGTSMACPVVAGAAALLIDQQEALRGEPVGLIRRILELTAGLPPGPHNLLPRGGKGRLHLAQI
jgi:subtilisin family serine protease